MTNYLCKFIPKYSEITTPLRELLHNEVHRSFDKPQKEAIERLKQMITNAPILQFYNPKLRTKLTTDTSKIGLGAVLQQKHGNI